MQVLKRAYLGNAARNALLFKSLGVILEALTGAGIRVIVLKGAALADTVYPERALRPMNDIDLLIREEDLGNAEVELQRVGYSVVHDSETKDDLRRGHHHWIFCDARPFSSEIPLELHWRLDPPGWPYRVDTAALWERAAPAKIAGIAAEVLSPEDLLLHLCTHTCRHRFNGGLLALCDIAAVIDSCGDRIDWRQVEARAAEWNAVPFASIPLHLAAELLGARVPAAVLAALRSGVGDADLLDQARERILEEKGTLRAAAELRLRWQRRGSKETVAALQKRLSPQAKHRTPVGGLFRRYAPLAWSLVRHPSTVAAIAKREARKSRLDSWCSPSSEEGRAPSH